MPLKIPKSQVDFPYAIRSFVGYLEGTDKSFHTIKNYKLDLSAFQDFITHLYPNKQIKLSDLSRKDVDHYKDHLNEKGLKANTRRRKLLTVTQFFNYLSKRKKVSQDLAHKFPTPHKIERVPFTISSQDLVTAIVKLTEESLINLRNKALLWTLAETGCLVSEISKLCFDEWVYQEGTNLAFVHFGGKASRSIPVSAELYHLIMKLKKNGKESSWIFSGFNRFGSLGSPITSRGIEILVKHYTPVLGFKTLTPRTFRHSVILKWFAEGLSQGEIQVRLGLKTTYAFRSYEPLLRSKSQTTSTFENPRQES